MGSMEHKITMRHIDVSRLQTKRLAKSVLQDWLVVFTAYAVAFWVRSLDTELVDHIRGLSFTVYSAATLVVCLYLFGVYQRIWERTSGHGITVIINAVGAATVVIVLTSTLLPDHPLPISVIVVGNALALSGFIAVRYRSRLISGASWRWRAIWYHEFPTASTVRVLIVGAGESGQAIAWRLKHRSLDTKYTVVGFVDDDPLKRNMYVEGSLVLGDRADIPMLAERHRVDLIVVAIHNISGTDFREILSFCGRTKVRIKVVPDMFALMNANRNVAFLRDVQPEDLIGRNTVNRHYAVDMTPVKNKAILVTGAAGSIGSELCRQLPEYKPTQLVLVDSNESGLHDLTIELSGKFPNARLTPVLADITDKDLLEAIFAEYKPQIVFHAAAYKHVPMLERYPEQAIRVNIGGTRNLAELAYEYAVERFVLISTDKAVNPSSVMGASKRVCELMLSTFNQQYGHQTLYTSVRFGNVLGSRGSVVPTFNRQIDNGGPVTITDPEMTRYFMSIPEASNLVIHAACLTKGGDIFLLKMGEVVRVVDLAERMIRLRGLRPYIDIPIHFTGIRPGEKLHEELYTDLDEVLETDHPSIIQLVNHQAYLNTDLLMDNVDQLLGQRFGSNANAMKALLQVIDVEQYSIIASPDTHALLN